MGFLRSGLAGAIGGLAGAWAMQQFRLRWDVRRGASPETGIFGFDKEADLGSVDQICAAFNLAVLPENEALQAALWLHYAYGVLSGAAYGVAVAQRPTANAGYGMAFGAALWLIGDELAITMAGLSDPRTRKPASHASALFTHILFGVVTEGGRKVFFSLLPPPQDR